MPTLFVTLLKSHNATLTGLHRLIGHSLSGLSVIMAMLVALVVILRFFDHGSTALQESVTYLHSTVFMLCLGFAGINGAHVRVDICYRRYPEQTRAWVNLIGSIVFLLPFSVFLAMISFDAALQSWSIREASINAGGGCLLFIC